MALPETEQAHLSQWAVAAVSADPGESEPAIAALRRAGPQGLDALLRAHARQLREREDAPIPIQQPSPDPHWQRLTAALDAVAMARDTHAARLYWYTDWDEAADAARASGRPILSLRLMGKLTDEYSCANSRFFRTVLYANAELSRYLREHYVLHWKSVRPVPRVSIDFGDGRRLERTLTGNSIHYVLNPDGRVIDALPGLYGPGAFLMALQGAAPFASALACAPPADREAMLHRYHDNLEVRLVGRWGHDLRQLGVALPFPMRFAAPVDSSPAERAMVLSVTKAAVEFPLLMQTVPTADTLRSATDESLWMRLAALHHDEARLDDSSLRLMREKSALMRRSATWNVAGGKLVCNSEMIERFTDDVARDTVRNDYLFRRTIHEWLSQEGDALDVETLNARVYADLFLTPESDAWLGLLPAGVYSALADDGVAQVQ